MEKVNCQSCKQEIPLIEPYVQFNCPECGKPIARCESCPVQNVVNLSQDVKVAVLSVTLTNANADLKDHKFNLV